MTTTCIMFSFEENRYTGIYILILIKYEQNLKVPDETQELWFLFLKILIDIHIQKIFIA